MNPIKQIINNKVQAIAKQGKNGKYQGIIAYANNPNATILETAHMYNSEQKARHVMLNEIATIKSFS